MALGSDGNRARARVKIELWSWTTWVVLCIISYPAVAIALAARWAGLVAGLAVGSFLVANAGLGYAGRRTLDPWPRATVSALAAAALVALAAVGADRVSPTTGICVAAAAAAEMLFVWYALPRIVREAEASEGRARSVLEVLTDTPRAAPAPSTQPTLSAALLLGFVMLGAGALWHRGMSWAPNPIGWCVALVLLALGLMFVARMSFSERSAREGNLHAPPGCYRRWLAAALATLALAALVALAIPWRAASTLNRGGWTGTAAANQPPGRPSAGESAGQAAAEGAAALRELLLGAAGARRELSLFLLLLILFAALVLAWVVHRTRLISRLRAALSRLAAWWRRLLAAVQRWLFRPARRKPVEQAPNLPHLSDPLLDIFDDPQLLSRLSPREVLIRTYHLLLNHGEMMGHGRGVGETPFEYAESLDRAVPQASEDVRTLTWGYAAAMYAGGAVALPGAEAVKLAWRRVADALKGGLSPEDFDLRRRAYLAARQLDRAKV